MADRASPLSKVCGVIAAPTAEEMREAATSAATGIIELRVDALDELGTGVIEALTSLIKEIRGMGKRVIVTLRDADEGGGFVGSPEEKARTLLRLARARPDYIDVEMSNPLARNLTKKILAQGTSVILSSHHLDTPLGVEDIEALVARASRLAGHATGPGAGLLVKVVYACRTPRDELPAMVATAESSGGLISFATGRNCVVSRALAPFLGAPFTYAHAHGGPQAPGQPSVAEVMGLWRVLGLI